MNHAGIASGSEVYNQGLSSHKFHVPLPEFKPLFPTSCAYEETLRAMNMSHLAQSLQSAASKNHELLTVLSSTDYAPTALKQNTAYIADLESQIKQTDADLVKLHRTTEDERKDHLKYRDSTFKRYAHKLRGSKGEAEFATKQEKEEREFMQAWQKEREAEERRAELCRDLEAAQTEKSRLEAESSRHTAAQSELDHLYASIFSGPTPEIPEEDRMEQTVQQARQWLEQCQTSFNTEKSAGQALRRVEARLDLASRQMANALQASRYDAVGGGSFIDMMERDALSHAQIHISESLRHMDDARHQQPAIAPLPDVRIDHGHMLSDVFFDNIFTDLAQHDRIKSSDAQLKDAIRQLQEQIRLQLDRAGGAKAQLEQARENMEAARLELQRIRGEAFERVTAGGSVGGADVPPPPPYQSMAA